MTITEAGEQYGLSTDTLRYYERIGLIPPVTRTKGGVRNYSETDCKWVAFIKCMRAVGIPVEALVEYVALFQKGKSTREARKAILREQRTVLAARLVEMQAALEKLDHKIENYDTFMVTMEDKLEGGI
jgi:DNA-binding transcriptional MerR regulator